MENLRHNGSGLPKIAGGVCAVVKDDSVLLSTLGSASRGTQRKEWKVPLPAANPRDYCFYPDADVMAFFFGPQDQLRCVHSWWQSKFRAHFQCSNDFEIEIHLKTVSGGRDHPAARCPTIHYSLRDALMGYISTVSITSSRLMAVARPESRVLPVIIIWDWKTSQVLFVCQLFP